MNNASQSIPKLGDVYMVNFNGDDSVQRGYRPGVVIQNNTGNFYSPNVIILPLTSCVKKLGQPTHVLVKSEDTDLVKDSIVLCENPKTVSKNQLFRYITTLSDEYIRLIAEGYLLATSIMSYIDIDMLFSLFEKSKKLNDLC